MNVFEFSIEIVKINC